MAKNSTKEMMTIVAIIVGAFAVYKISSGVSKGISDVGSGLGEGLNNLLSGAGQGVSSSGKGVEYLGQGVGGGIYEIGSGVGGGLFQIGTGVSAIGQGAGYGLSGLNAQDIVQTILTLGKGEASTYNSTLKLSQDSAKNQGQDSGASTFAKTQVSTETTTLMTSSSNLEQINAHNIAAYNALPASQKATSQPLIYPTSSSSISSSSSSISSSSSTINLGLPSLISVISGGKPVSIPTPPVIQVVQSVGSSIGNFFSGLFKNK